MRTRTIILPLAIVLTLALAVYAAGGDIVYVGSSTIAENIIADAAPAFTAKTGIRFSSIQVQGSGQGIELVLHGQAELAGASRTLTKDEKRAPMYYEVIGYDAVAIVVHQDNPVTTLSRRQLKAIYTGRIRSWKDVGGRDAPIVVITLTLAAGRGQMTEFATEVLDGESFRADRHEVDKQTDEVAALRSERNAITTVSYAYLRSGIKSVAIEGFAPDREHVRSGAYLLSRPLLLLAPRHPRDEVKRFLAFMLSEEGQSIVARKFVAVR